MAAACACDSQAALTFEVPPPPPEAGPLEVSFGLAGAKAAVGGASVFLVSPMMSQEAVRADALGPKPLPPKASTLEHLA